MSYNVNKIIEEIQSLENNVKESKSKLFQKEQIISEKELKITQLTSEIESLKSERNELIQIIKNLINHAQK